jgi:hypothetical protein
MAPGECDEPFGDWTRRLWPSLHNSFISQVTMGYDLAFTLKGAFDVRE